MSDNYIRKIRIYGLHGLKSVFEVDFVEGVNCLYGVNGSGKTTIINLVTACLSCNFDSLAKIQFSSVHIFITKSGNKRPLKFLEVTREDSGLSDEGEDFFDVITTKNKLRYKSYELSWLKDSFDGKRMRFEVDGDIVSYPPSHKVKNTLDIDGLSDKITSSINLTHLPLTRMHASEAFDFEDNDYDIINNFKRRRVSQDDISKLLDTGTQVITRIQKDFGDLYRKKQDEINVELEGLKQKILNRLLIDKDQLNKNTNEVLRRAVNHRYDLKDIISKLEEADIFPDKGRVVEHFEVWELAIRELQEAKQEFEEQPRGKNFDHKVLKTYMDAHSRALSFASTFERFFSVVDDVKEMQKRKEKKMSIFDDFKKTVNMFLHNKNLVLSKNMEFLISSSFRHGKESVASKISLSELSSGEKHIIAILGRVALQENESSVFVADEPELSLHLEWQRKILPAVRSLSPSMQIIVATHSPAIIPDDANMIDVEECFSYD